jgi:hypothetical protein
MIKADKLFENFFDDPKIINARLAVFGTDCLSKLSKDNDGGRFDDLISSLTPPLNAMQQELGDIASALGIQKGVTVTVKDTIKNFKAKMLEYEGVIAHSLGGRNSPAFIEFYPQSTREYSEASQTNLPTLLKRVKQAATTHAATIGSTIATELQGFDAAFAAAKDVQSKKKGDVKENRSDRTTARKQVEIALCTIIHDIGKRFPGDVQRCMSFFDFGLLEKKGAGKKSDDKNSPAAQK